MKRFLSLSPPLSLSLSLSLSLELRWSDCEKLPFLTKCCMETLRLWTAVPNGTFRELQYDDEVRGPGGKMVELKKGTFVQVVNLMRQVRDDVVCCNCCCSFFFIIYFFCVFFVFFFVFFFLFCVCVCVCVCVQHALFLIFSPLFPFPSFPLFSLLFPPFFLSGMRRCGVLMQWNLIQIVSGKGTKSGVLAGKERRKVRKF